MLNKTQVILYLCNMEFRKLKDSFWEFSKDGKAKFKGNIYQPKNNKIEHKGVFLDVQYIINSLFKDKPQIKTVKEVKPIIEGKRVHGNKGRKHKPETIEKIKAFKRSAKAITFEDVTYRDIKEAIKATGLSKASIYRINKKALQT